MNITRLPIVIILVFLFFSCKEKETVQTVQVKIEPDVKLISHVTYGTDPEAEKWYEYTPDGDLFRYNSIIDTVLLTYSQDTIYKRYFNKSSDWLTEIKYYLDKSGKVIGSSILDQEKEEISRYKFEYNDQGYLSKALQDVLTSGSSYLNEFLYNDGNLTEVIMYTADGEPGQRYVYEYYMDKANELNIFMHGILDDFLMKDRLGKLNKNLVKQMACISMEGDTLSLLKFSYPENKENNQFTEIITDDLNEIETVKIYHFNK
jgi:hypothetical protein